MISRACALGVIVSAAVSLSATAKTIQVAFDEGTNFAVALSPSDGSLVLDLQGTLWRVPPEGGKAAALTDGLGDDRLPDVARDGRSIVFQSYRNGTWDVYAIDADGGNATALTEGPADDREPTVSPDGKRVAFSSDRSGNYDVWVLDLDTREIVRITDDEANDYMPAWSPTGKELVFVSERDPDGATGLYRVEAREGAVPVSLASFPSPIASPSFSLDGKLIAVRVLELEDASAGAMGRAARASRLAVVPTIGGDPRFLATPEDVFPFRASWASPNEIVYTASGKIWKQSVIAGAAAATEIPFHVDVSLDRPAYRRRPVAFPEGRERRDVRGLVRPVVAPDGSLIAYTALGDLWVVSPDGGDPVPLTRDEALDSDPCWSPDSRSLVFSSDREGTMDLWIKDVSAPPSTGEKRLTTSLGAELTPSWSPDGKTIAYLDQESRLHVIGVDGTSDRILTAPRHGVGIPSWSSDSVHIAMAVHVPISTRFREGYNRISIVDTTSGESRILDEPDRSFGNRDGDGPVFNHDGSALAFAMDGGLWTMPVSPAGDVKGKPKRIVGEPVDFPSYTGDGKRIFFLGANGLSVVDVGVEGGEPRKVPLRQDFEVKPPAGRFAIRNVRLIDATGAPPRDGMDVFIQGDRIERIDATGASIEEGMRVVDGTGKTLIPGLIEMHAHMGLPAWGSRQGKVWLSYGVTSMRTPEDAIYRVLEERESIEAGRRVGPRVFFTGASMDGDRVYYSYSLAIGDSEELKQEMTRAIGLGYDLVKTYVRLPDTLQKEAIEEAHAEGIFVTSHEVYPAVAYGIDGIEHLRGTSRRGYSPKITDLRRTYDDVIELIARSGVYFTPTVLIHGAWALALAREPELLRDPRFVTLFPPFAQDAYRGDGGGDREKSKDVVAPMFRTIAAIHERGGKIVAGTDSAIVPYGLGLILEVEALSEAGLGPMAAIEAATRVAAEGLGAGRDLGTVEPGKIADLVLLGGDPTEDIHNLRKTEIVIVDGRLLNVEQLLKIH